MNRFLRPLAAFSLLAFASSSFAWIDTGHMVIAAIAEGRLNKTAWDECDRLLKIGGTPETKGFIAASVWADDTKTKENGPWHYIDFPYRTDGKPTQTKPGDENAAWAINHFSDILKDKTKPDADRADALRYLIHIVGDIHQPMHAISRESDEHPTGDRGGNDFPIKTGDLFASMERPPTNLHFLWDMGVGEFMPGIEKRPLGPDGEGRIRIMGQNLTVKFPVALFKDQVNDLDPMVWAKESFNSATQMAYKVRTGGEIDLSYAGPAKTIAGARAALAGYRLAALLNKLVGGVKVGKS
jgi:hypothetical protein